jgi:hypothetical protein
MSSRGLAWELMGDAEIAGGYECFADDNQEHQEEGVNNRWLAGFNDVFTPFATSL